MRTLNLGILAHVDAGKTTLTERLLYAVGVIDEIGSVDDGTTQTDSLALERRRGITIKSAVVSFLVDDVIVNLIDTPGHPDFIAEVERVLNVLDGAVLVISGVEGVQPQTRVLMRTLQRLNIPTLLFVNKIDRGGARGEGVLREIAESLTPAIVPMGAPEGLGTRAALVTPYGREDTSFITRLADVLADHDDEILNAYLADEATVSFHRLRTALAAQTKKTLVHPVFFGSAISGAGVDHLMAGLTELLPTFVGDDDAPESGTVFKVERGPAGERIAYVRMFAGAVRVRDRLSDDRKVTAIRVFDRGSAVERPVLGPGRIGKLWGLSGIQIGDAIGSERAAGARHHFAPPTLETVVVPSHPADKGALYAALAQLAEQDPLIDLRQDDVREELYVSLYGEVQKEVIRDTLSDEYDLAVSFRETTTICIERPIGSGAAVEILGKAHNPFLATIGLRVEPSSTDSGVDVRIDVDVKSIPLYVFKTVEDFRDALRDAVLATLRQGLYGWEVADCVVTMTESGYSAPGTRASDFRKLLPLVLMNALKEAGTVVCEPIHRFRLECPASALGGVLSALARLSAIPQAPGAHGSSTIVEGEIAAARMHELQQPFRALTRGEGILEFEFDRYEPVHGPPPTRPRSDHNPLNRRQYLREVKR